MTEFGRDGGAEARQFSIVNAPEPKPTAPPPMPPEPATPQAGASGPERTLTPEEQMARFEEELKFDDWGHQPC
jgi:hypothetical protein